MVLLESEASDKQSNDDDENGPQQQTANNRELLYNVFGLKLSHFTSSLRGETSSLRDQSFARRGFPTLPLAARWENDRNDSLC
jgi:hypothetical protein